MSRYCVCVLLLFVSRMLATVQQSSAEGTSTLLVPLQVSLSPSVIFYNDEEEDTIISILYDRRCRCQIKRRNRPHLIKEGYKIPL